MDKPNSWISFDFKDRAIYLTKYSLKTVSWTRPLQWVIEGSNNGSNWTELDRRNAEDKGGNDSSFLFLELRQTGRNNHLYFSKIEFFGTVRYNHRYNSESDGPGDEHAV